MMMKEAKYILFFVFVLIAGMASAQSGKRLVRKGNSDYQQNKYSDAEVNYKKALDKKPNYVKGKFNLGDAYYQEKNFKDADSLFTEVASTAKSSGEKAKAWYNKGNTLMVQKKYRKSIDAYKNALRLTPTDTAAKYNLEYARKKLKKQKQQKKNNKKKKNKNQKKKQNKNKQNKKKKEQKNKNKQKQKQNNNKQKQGGQKKQQKHPRQHLISKQEAKRMLDALKNNEKKTLHKLELQKAKAAHHKSKIIDW